jgi:hypothetical protein
LGQPQYRPTYYDDRPMPDKTPCPNCQRIGFVRQEHIIRGGNVSVAYYCGHCNHTWTQTEADARRVPRPELAAEQPERSR